MRPAVRQGTDERAEPIAHRRRAHVVVVVGRRCQEQRDIELVGQTGLDQCVLAAALQRRDSAGTIAALEAHIASARARALQI